MVNKVCFGEKLHKNITLSLEPSPHNYLVMGVNVGGVNQEGDKCNGDSVAGVHC